MTSPLDVLVEGPLSLNAAGFCEELAALGYTPLSAANQVRLLAHLSRWLQGRGFAPGDVTADLADRFLEDRRAAGYTHLVSRRGLAPVLRFLRGAGVVPGSVVGAPVTPVERLVVVYRCFLVDERGLAVSTVRHREATARMFLSACADGNGELDLAGVTAEDVTGFVVAECSRCSVGAAKNLVSNLRSLLRFLHIAGYTTGDLAEAVPAVAGWRGTSLPRGLEPAEVAALLAGCDRSRLVGRRDYAILLLLSRLGLRAGEVAGLLLDDIDWRRGELAVSGKGRRQERVPLPVDVGEAVAAYLAGRAGGGDRAVFLAVRAPRRPLSSTGVTMVVRYGCDRAGLARVGAHRLRHTAATEMVRAGSSLAEVGQVLRHRAMSTTAIYAKVDTASLRPLALPWPGTPR